MYLDTTPSATPATIVSLDAHRANRRAKPGDAMRLFAIFAVCFFGFIGSFADSAVARTALLFIESPSDVDGAKLGGLAGTVLWGMVVNVTVCGAILLLGYWAISRPQAQVIRLRPSRDERRD